MLCPRFRYRLQGQHFCLVQVKQHYRDVILFFKIGSFYEVILSALLPTSLPNLAVYAALAPSGACLGLLMSQSGPAVRGGCSDRA